MNTIYNFEPTQNLTTQMDITFLGQGYEPASELSVGKKLIEFLADRHYNSFIGISAFASQAGVNGLAKHIATAKHLKITIVTGVDQKSTSKEALEALLNLNINAFIFYQPSFSIFHPKIYLFEGQNKSQLIIGSSNLTTQGLFRNVETSLLISINNRVPSERKIIEHLKQYFSGIFDETDVNLRKISIEVIDALVKAKVVPTEAERAALQDKEEKKEKLDVGDIISKIFPKRAIAKIPVEFRGRLKRPTKKGVEFDTKISMPAAIKTGDLVWQKKNLPSSDAQQVKENTKITGVLRLGDANFKVDGVKIDRNTYFRNKIFSQLDWSIEDRTRTNNTRLETAKGQFNISILGENIGKHDLKISHDDERISHQHNIPTTIHWGSTIISYLKQHNVIGATLSLYSPPQNSKVYSIVIAND